MPLCSRFCALAAIACVAWLACEAVPACSAEPAVTGATSSSQVDGAEYFEKKVRPLLAARCHECHGPNKQKANLRLDSREAVLKGGDTGPAIVPGEPEQSLLVDAIRYGETYQMPPKSQLPADEIEVLVNWVRLGAPWGADRPSATGAAQGGVFDLKARAGHWSLQPIAAPKAPEVADASWPINPIDHFVLAALERAGMQPAEAADRYALLRRVTYDLTGLPPTPDEIRSFVADRSPAAYARVVERLLDSPSYGERWARHWLDLVRFAETHGHEFDFDMPNAYRYRDYVVRALNADLPYDKFVIEHLAGDLLSPPRRNPLDGTNESIIGTGFFFFGEAKHSPVDVRQDEADRMDNQIDVLAKTFLGLTVSCARCHDHKFDAISTEDYYALAGYLQSSRYQQAFIDPPQMFERPVAELSAIEAERQEIARTFVREQAIAAVGGLAEALLEARSATAGPWREFLDLARKQPESAFHVWAVLADEDPNATQSFVERSRKLAKHLQARAQTAAAKEKAGETIMFADFSDKNYEPWRTTGWAFGSRPIPVGQWSPRTSFDCAPANFACAAAAHSGRLSERLQGTLRSPTFEISKPRIAYRLFGTGGRVRLVVDGLQLIRNPIYGGLEFSPKTVQPYWHEQDVSKWIGHRAYIELLDEGNHWLALEKVVFCDQMPSEPKANPLLAAALGDERIASLESLARAYQDVCRRALDGWLAQSTLDRAESEANAGLVNDVLHLPNVASAARADCPEQRARLVAVDEKQAALTRDLPTPRLAMAMADGTAEDQPVFIRGSHKTPGAVVPRRCLEVLGGTRFAPPTEGSGRLELAQQLVAENNPLVARVIVNRLWHHHFGAGLVRSPDDFGVMGQGPTHGELLDYLATMLKREGWSLKAIHRLIVLSRTYQMSSRTRAEADEADPQNKLWHRRNPRRLEAEAIRDGLLTVSGRLNSRTQGPSIMPHLTSYMTGRGRPAESGPLDGDGRRTLYLSVRRNFLSPMLQAFDYPTPFTTIGRRGTSNVPAQALTMMNNPFVREQAEIWARRVIAGSSSMETRVHEMYLAALGREPEPVEVEAALAFVREGENGQAAEHVWAELAHTLFNAKEFVFVP